MSKTTNGKLQLCLVLSVLVTLASLAFGFVQWRQANRAKAREAAARREAVAIQQQAQRIPAARKDTSETTVAQEQSEPGDAREKKTGDEEIVERSSTPPSTEATATTTTSEYLEPKSVIETYQELSKGYLAQAQILKTAQTRQRQSAALNLLKRAADLRHVTNDILSSSAVADESVHEGAKSFWRQQLPLIRSEAVTWLSEASLQPVFEEELEPEQGAPSRSEGPALAVCPERKLLVVFKPPTRVEIKHVDTGDRQASFDVPMERGHNVIPGSVAFSADGEQVLYCSRQAYSSSQEATLHFVDAKTGEEVKNFTLTGLGGSPRQTSLSFSQDRRRLLVGGFQPSVWDVAEGRQIRSFQGLMGERIQLADSGDIVLSFGDHRSRAIKFIEVDTGKEIRTIEPQMDSAGGSMPGMPGMPRGTYWTLTPDSQWLVSLRPANDPRRNGGITLVVLDAKTGKLISQNVIPNLPSDAVVQIAVSPGSRFISLLTSEQLLLAEFPSGRVVKRHTHPKLEESGSSGAGYPGRSSSAWAPVALLVPSSGNLVTLLAQSGYGKSKSLLQFWEVILPATTTQTVMRHDQAVTDLQYAADGKQIVSSARDGTIRLWKDDGSVTWTCPSPLAREDQMGLARFWSQLSSGPVAFSPSRSANSQRRRFSRDGASYVSAHDGQITFWDLKSCAKRREIPARQVLAVNWPVARIALRVAEPGITPAIQIYDVATDQFVTTLSDPQWRDVGTVQFTPDGAYLVSTTSSALTIGRTDNGQTKVVPLNSRAGPQETGVVMAPSSKQALVLNQSFRSPSSLQVVELSTGEQIASWTSPPTRKEQSYGPPRIASIKFDSSGKRIAFVRSADETAELYYWAVGESEPTVLKTPFKEIEGIYLTGESRVVVWGGVQPWNQMAVLLDAETGETLLSTYQPPAIAESRHAPVSVKTNDTLQISAINYQDADNVSRCAIWDLEKAEVLREYQQSATFMSTDGKYLVLAGREDEPHRVVDMSSGETRFEFSGRALRFSSDNQTLLNLEAGNQFLNVWSLETNERTARVAINPRDTSTICCIGQTLVVYNSTDATIQVQDLAVDSNTNQIPLNTTGCIPGARQATVTQIELSPSGQHLAVEVNGQTRIISLEEGEYAIRLPRSGHQRSGNRSMARPGGQPLGVRGISISADAQLVASAGDDRTVCFWSLADGQYRGMLDGFAQAVQQAFFVQEGQGLLTLDQAGQLVMWQRAERASEQSMVKFQPAWSHAESALAAPPGTRPEFLPSFCVNAKQQLLACCYPNGQVVIRDVASGKEVHRLAVSEDAAIAAATFDPRDLLIIGQSDGRVSVWQLGSDQPVRTWVTGHRQLKTMALTADGSQLATAGDGICLWSLETEELLLKVNPQDGDISAACFDVTELRLASGSEDGSIVAWSPDDYRQMLEPVGLGWKSSQAVAARIVREPPAESIVSPPASSTQKELPAAEGAEKTAAPSASRLPEGHPRDIWAMYQKLHQHREELRQRVGKDGPNLRSMMEEMVEPAMRKKSTDELIELVKNSDIEVFTRGEAVEALQLRQADADKVVPLLVDLITGNEDFLASNAITALGEFGPAAAAALPALFEKLKQISEEPGADDARPTLDYMDRLNMAMAIGDIGPTAAPFLAEKLDDEVAEIRELAADALDSMQQVRSDIVPQLTNALLDKNKQVRKAVATTLGKIGPEAAAALPPLRQMMQEDDASLRVIAADTIRRITGSAQESVPVLISALEERNQETVQRAALVLRWIGKDAEPAQSALQELLTSADRETRIYAATAIASFDPSDKAIVPVLMEGLKMTPVARGERELGAVGRAQPDVLVPQLIELLDDFRSRAAAARVLGQIGPPAKAAIPKLSNIMRDQDPNVRRGAMGGLVRLGPDGMRAVVADIDDAELTTLAVTLASSLAPRAQALRAGVEPTTPREREMLEQLSDGSEHVDWLLELVADDDSRVAGMAVYCLSVIREIAIPKLTTAMRDSRATTRSGAILAIGEIDKTSTDSESLLVKASGDDDASVRWSAVTALGRREAISDTGMAALRKAMQDSDPQVQAAARNAVMERQESVPK